jgi:hypothetical protein
MLFQTIEQQVSQNTGMLGTYVDPCVYRALFAFLLPELEEKLKGIVPDLEEVRIAALFPAPIDGRISLGIVNTHDNLLCLGPLKKNRVFLPELIWPSNALMPGGLSNVLNFYEGESPVRRKTRLIGPPLINSRVFRDLSGSRHQCRGAAPPAVRLHPVLQITLGPMQSRLRCRYRYSKRVGYIFEGAILQIPHLKRGPQERRNTAYLGPKQLVQLLAAE